MNEFEQRLKTIDGYIEYIIDEYGNCTGEMAISREMMLKALHELREKVLCENGRRRAEA
jgi:hypothetical protein